MSRPLDVFLYDPYVLTNAEFALGAASVASIVAVVSAWPFWRAVQDFWGGAWL